MTSTILMIAAWSLALLAMASLAWSNGRRASALRRQLDDATAATRQAYARGQSDGLTEGLRRGKGEAETTFRKADYQKGYDDGYHRAWAETLEVVSEADAARQAGVLAA